MGIISTICLVIAGVCLGALTGFALSENFEWRYQKAKVILSYVIPIIVFALVFLIPTFWKLLE